MIYRTKKVIRNTILFIFIGLAYAGLSSLTGIGLPCMFHFYTGLYCPSCGVSRMCLNIIKGDYRTAYCNNRCIFLLLPVFTILLVFNMLCYIKTGKAKPGRFQQFIFIFIIIILVIFGILRNIPSFSYLGP